MTTRRANTKGWPLCGAIALAIVSGLGVAIPCEAGLLTSQPATSPSYVPHLQPGSAPATVTQDNSTTPTNSALGIFYDVQYHINQPQAGGTVLTDWTATNSFHFFGPANDPKLLHIYGSTDITVTSSTISSSFPVTFTVSGSLADPTFGTTTVTFTDSLTTAGLHHESWDVSVPVTLSVDSFTSQHTLSMSSDITWRNADANGNIALASAYNVSLDPVPLVTPIPEPATFAMAGTGGLCCLLGFAWRQRKRSV